MNSERIVHIDNSWIFPWWCVDVLMFGIGLPCAPLMMSTWPVSCCIYRCWTGTKKDRAACKWQSSLVLWPLWDILETLASSNTTWSNNGWEFVCGFPYQDENNSLSIGSNTTWWKLPAKSSEAFCLSALQHLHFCGCGLPNSSWSMPSPFFFMLQPRCYHRFVGEYVKIGLRPDTFLREDKLRLTTIKYGTYRQLWMSAN